MEQPPKQPSKFIAIDVLKDGPDLIKAVNAAKATLELYEHLGLTEEEAMWAHQFTDDLLDH